MKTYEKTVVVLMVLILLNVTYISYRLSPLGSDPRWPPVEELASQGIPPIGEARTIPDQLSYMGCGIHYLLELEMRRQAARSDADTADDPTPVAPPTDPQN